MNIKKVITVGIMAAAASALALDYVKATNALLNLSLHVVQTDIHNETI